MAQLLKGFTWASGAVVTPTKLNNAVDEATALAGLITEQTRISDPVAEDDDVLLYDASGNVIRKASRAKLVYVAGDVKPWIFSTPQSGWLFLSGLTIGSASSGATARANADALELFSKLWSDFSNTLLPIQTSAGAPTTRGGSAQADFDANKRMPLPDLRGATFAGRDDMGGTAANRLTTAGSGVDGATLGTLGGSQSHTLTSAQSGVGNHTHGVNDPQHSHFTAVVTQGANIVPIGSGSASLSNNNVTSSTSPTNISIQNTSANATAAHPIVQPTFVGNWIIKY